MEWLQHCLKYIVQNRIAADLKSHEPLRDTEPMTLRVPEGPNPVSDRLCDAMTDDEKCSFIAGVDDFCIPGVSRLGLKPVWTSDATMGLRGWRIYVTDFPATIAMAATFDRSLIDEVGRTIAEECRAVGVSMILGPGVNIARVPTCGRNFEYCGEDPYLAGEIAAAYIQGIQSKGIIATVKHFACNNSDYDRHKCNSVVDERTLRELYLPAFERAVEAGVLAVMTSYNQINGTYAAEHPYLIGQILKGDWHFDGMVVSDWNSLYSTGPTIKEGVDLEMPGPKWFSKSKVRKALAEGKITMADIDRKVRSILHVYDRVGLFDRPVVDSQATVGTKEHAEVAERVGEGAVVLLKNEGPLLPLPVDLPLKVCVGGRNALRTPSGGGSSRIRLDEKPETLADALRKQKHVEVTVLPHRWWRSRRLCRQVASSDVNIFCTGYDHDYESETYDRQWALPSGEDRSIAEALARNDKTVVIVQSGGDFKKADWLSRCPALLEAFYLGSNTSKVLVDILFGRTNPSGRLPFSMVNHLSDHRSISHYARHFDRISPRRIQGGQGNPARRTVWDMEYRENLMVGYRLFDTERIPVAFPFGHGLGYTSFSYRDPAVERRSDGTVEVFVTVRNVGEREGREVVQLYVHEQSPAVTRPEQELKGFSKVLLAPGEERRVSCLLPERAFSHYDTKTWSFVAGTGPFEIRIGASSRDIRSTIVLKDRS